MDTVPDIAPTPSAFSLFNVQANRRIYQQLTSQIEYDRAYIAELQGLLESHNIEIPETIVQRVVTSPICKPADHTDRLMPDGSLNSLMKSVTSIKDHNQMHEIYVQYRNLTFWNMVADRKIPTVGSTIRNIVFGSGPKRRVDVIKDLTGRILPKTMTLLMGPPGCGKTTFLKALSCQLNKGSGQLDGEILYNGDSVDCGKYLVGKITSYVDERDQHAPTLTVRETLEFAWRSTTAGHHSYNVARDSTSAEVLDRGDAALVKLKNMITGLGLSECANTMVGDGVIRGISGGQKRRVTLGEMLMPPRSIKYMDAISNGLDAATTYDLTQAMKLITKVVGLTTVVSLLQPAPDVFYSFEDLILMSEGEIVYHGPTTRALEYFADLGYKCPAIMDVADFLQEVPFTVGNTTSTGAPPPTGTAALVKAWKESDMFKAILEEMDIQVKESTGQWPAVFSEYYPGTFWDSFKLCLERQMKLTLRDSAFIKGRVLQSVVVAAIAGSLFSNLDVEEANAMSGILYFCGMFGAVSAMATLPMIFEQRAVFYKHSRSLFFPTPAFVLAQTVVMIPMQIFETISFTTIIYWSVGLSDDNYGGRYFSFMFIVFVFSLCVSQFFRLVASNVASSTIAQTLAGVVLILMVLFSGYIIPKSNIPPGWIWFYWLNPIAYVLRSVTVNEFLASDYDFPVCLDETCSATKRFGDLVLESRGNPTEQVWVWYGVAVLIAMYIFFLLLSMLALTFVRTEPAPPPPIPVESTEESDADDPTEAPAVQIPFDPVSFAFKDIWYTVKIGKEGEELDLLKGVSGYFEPGTLTALMGSSGAGKTTLLDVLSGRKNTGEIAGGMFVNGHLKDAETFKNVMGYVEQFDSLSPRDTVREAVEFSATLRLPRETTAEMRTQWVTTVLSMLELLPLENTMIGNEEVRGLSYEQKKRVSIAVELAANPAVLFLDEPTTGLDSRAAQVVIRCIKRVAASGRTIVCTIHQPSAVIFEAFDSLLLLRRGGQTVYFGELGENFTQLVSYLEGIPGVSARPQGSNPATWMLEVIGAGTSGANATVIDFHAYYLNSAQCTVNTQHVNALTAAAISPDDIESGNVVIVKNSECGFVPVFFGNGGGPSMTDGRPRNKYNATYMTQFRVLMYRFLLAYWRSPTYNFVRMVVSVVIALIFASTYADQKYTSDVDVISRVAVIYVTLFFMGIVGMKSVQPVILDERPAFYREMYGKMYDIKLYVLANTLVEVPYLIISSLMFVIPFFFIVGFDKDGTAEKFFWYWLFQALYVSLMVFLGHFLSTALPTAAIGNVVAGMLSTFISIFCGFLIKPEDFASFWVFMYWLDPLHYAIEGLIVTQFNRDSTVISITGTQFTTTANTFIQEFYTEWKYAHRGFDVLALLIFILFFRVATYWSLEYMRHDKR